MAKKLNTNVSVADENGEAHWFGPDDDLPDWAEKAITNPHVWADSAADGGQAGDDDGSQAGDDGEGESERRRGRPAR